MRIGIDVGGTNTDSVLMDGARLIHKFKTPTTTDITGGIQTALGALLASSAKGLTVDAVMVGTTHFTNALLQQRDLAVTGILRLCLPATDMLPPMVDWPEELRASIQGHTYLLEGGLEFDGREISPINESQIRDVTRRMASEGVQAVAIIGVFSSVDPTQEQIAAKIIEQETPHMRISMSHEIGRVGLLERENATILNACLSRVSESAVGAFKLAIEDLGLSSSLFLSQNDGTLMDAEFAIKYPVLAISSGPTNSMRGASFLTGIDDAIVADIGGTSTDVGILRNGFPRESSIAVDIGGVRTNFRMPDVLSIPLGGGSLVKTSPMVIGPDSVAMRLTDQSLVFGGSIMTTTDVAVAAGMADIGQKSLVSKISRTDVNEALKVMHEMVEEAIDRLKFNSDDIPVVLVGGGHFLINDQITGSTEVIRPENGEIANAIGAAIAQIGGQSESIFSLSEMTREEAISSATKEATTRAVSAGADPESISIVDIEEIPLTYLPSNAIRIRIKVVGNIPEIT